MKYCARCMYPENAKPTIIFDDEGVCSGCRYHESRDTVEVDWEERWEILLEMVEEAKQLAKERGNGHDCIIPVSGGKDSYFQVWLAKEKLGMNPLLVHFNHVFNTGAGQYNIRNLLEKSGCDMVEYRAGVDSVRRVARHMLETVGDITWHYHAGLRVFPMQVAVQRNIPLVLWGEHGFAELTGIVSLEDFVEFTRWTVKEHDMRGIDPEDLIGKGGIGRHDIAPYIYPSDEDLERVEVRGIYLSNFLRWDAKKQTDIVMKEWDFSPVTYKRGRTFNLHSKIEDHAQEIHDYLKYVKFGYGRATDDVSTEIRLGRLTRAEGKALVKEYDAHTPHSLEYYCEFLGISVDQFYALVEPMRDASMWEKNANGEWQIKDAIWLHEDAAAEEKAKVEINQQDHVFNDENNRLYYNADKPPEKRNIEELDVLSEKFRVN